MSLVSGAGSALTPDKSYGDALLAVNDPGAPRPKSAKKFFAFVQGSTDGQIEAMLVFGGNAIYPAFATGSSTMHAVYSGIIGRQCQRMEAFIGAELGKLEWEDDEAADEAVERIAAAIDLVGEPGIYAAYQHLAATRDQRFPVEKLLSAISSAKDDSTERHRINLLYTYCRDADIFTRYTAVEALGNMASHSGDARQALQQISKQEENSEIAAMAVEMSR